MDGKSINPYEPSSVVDYTIDRGFYWMIHIVNIFYVIYGGVSLIHDYLNGTNILIRTIECLNF